MDDVKQHRWVLVMHIPAKVQINEDGHKVAGIPLLVPQNIGYFPSFTMCFDCRVPLEDGWGHACWADVDEHMDDDFWKGLPQ